MRRRRFTHAVGATGLLALGTGCAGVRSLTPQDGGERFGSWVAGGGARVRPRGWLTRRSITATGSGVGHRDAPEGATFLLTMLEAEVVGESGTDLPRHPSFDDEPSPMEVTHQGEALRSPSWDTRVAHYRLGDHRVPAYSERRRKRELTGQPTGGSVTGLLVHTVNRDFDPEATTLTVNLGARPLVDPAATGTWRYDGAGELTAAEAATLTDAPS